MAYERVNETWPAGSNAGRDLKPTGEEAVRAIKLLWRKWMKRKFPYRIRITSGNRRTWIADTPRTFNVNPDERGGGWHEVVHSISHLVAYKLHPGTKPHSTQHHFIEREMVEHVVRSGWLDGKLQPKPKPAVDRLALRRDRIEAGIKRWETKRKRAETALRKLRQQQKRMARADAARVPGSPSEEGSVTQRRQQSPSQSCHPAQAAGSCQSLEGSPTATLRTQAAISAAS